MNTAMSSKRTFSSTRFEGSIHKSHQASLAIYALIASILVLAVGVQGNINVLMILGFFGLACSGLALNAMFWASYFTKHNITGRKFRGPYYY